MAPNLSERPRDMIPLKDDNPTNRPPIVTVGLIALNIIAHAYKMLLPPQARTAMIFQMGLIPAEVTSGISVGPEFPLPLTLFTSMFLHGGLLHLAGNMLYLWVFGNNVEDQAGHLRFLAFYMLCGVAAAATQIVASPDSQIPMIGASGAIAGVLGAYMLMFPHARVLTLVPIFIFIRVMYLPAVVVLGLWFLYQILLSASAGQGAEGGVAFFAHIGGFVAGMLLIWVFRTSRARRRRYDYDD